jgi:hypothetical protein
MGAEHHFTAGEVDACARRIGIALGLCFFACYLVIGLFMNLYGFFDTLDVFSESDIARVVCDMTMFSADHTRTNAHPTFVIFFNPIGVALSKIIGSKPAAAVIINSIFGGLCVTLAYIFFRRMRLGTLHSLLYSVALGLSACHLFFGSAPETHLYSAAGLIILFLLFISRPGSLKHFVPAGVFHFGVLITNIVPATIVFCCSLLGEKVKGGLVRRTATFVALVFTCVLVIAAVQQQVYPTSNPFFIPKELRNDVSRTTVPGDLRDAAVRFGNVAVYMLTADIIAPELEVGGMPDGSKPRLTCNPWSLKPLYLLGSLVMLALLLWAFHAFLRFRLYRNALMKALLLLMAFNAVLYFFYSNHIIFIFTCNWAFVMLVWIALSLQPYCDSSRNASAASTFLLVALIILEAFNNGGFVREVIAVFREHWLS